MREVITDSRKIGDVISFFSRTTDEIVTLEELKRTLESGRQLVMKYGVDVTAPDIHIGHAVNLWMYRKLQELGHKVVFLIGDFTTQIGDPTGKNKTRPIIPLAEIQRNADAFIKQAEMILHTEPEVLEVRRNSEWLTELSARELLNLMSMVTNDKLIAREMFRQRIAKGEEIYEHELIYPILQGYDSVILGSDLTIIGSDQLYNEMMGRAYQVKFGKKPQIIITTKITPGIDGKGKQSKSVGNYISLLHSPREKFGRIMSMPDNLVTQYFQVYTEVPLDEIAVMEDEYSDNLMEYKLRLAKEIVRRYHGGEIAEGEYEWFKKTFSKREVPDDAPRISIGAAEASIYRILRQCFPTEKSNGDIKRLIIQRAVTVSGNTVTDPEEKIRLTPEGIQIKAGKRTWFIVVP
ncbi:MAG: tyrosine--tRNA ligase [Candidatus Kerfeldbacteria bacterium CG_4_10_14_0_8_um_filter_42_10]|uniref:Tyrosine--tRNA ligase n=1 Tax=Candidatus Kerfeldbacteria bacterium CG_4_10_14_0_8_um_filter_42_10 TaxID=2014248 RepID=A0A2M7RJL7_9BACT|nr:MAG: tyrosine--tRNA ligase [Candidatus Kerfeldbacteria bacterium CG_4_10_14_0_8_um_filter_42_10]